MTIRYCFVLALTLVIAGCQHIDPTEQPLSMPRSALLFSYVPGVLPSFSEIVDSCEEIKIIQNEKNCQLVKRALGGSPEAAVSLARQRKKDNLRDEMIYWYTIAAENESVTGMEEIGRILYSSSNSTNASGDKFRGLFWLELAAKRGSKLAQEYLNQNDNIISSDVNIQHNARIPVTQDSNDENGPPENVVRCGGTQRCEEFSGLQRAALLGSGQKALYLQAYLARHTSFPDKNDYLYWGTIAAENGYTASMEWLGSFLSENQTTATSKIRGQFWLNKSRELIKEVEVK